MTDHSHHGQTRPGHHPVRGAADTAPHPPPWALPNLRVPTLEHVNSFDSGYLFWLGLVNSVYLIIQIT